MADPILLLVEDDPETLASLASALERRFGADYRVLTERSPASALARLEHACEHGEDVALVVAHLWMPEMTGLDLLARVHDLCPRASRCVLVSYGDGAAYPPLRRALVLGEVDTYLLKPWGDPEERLYPVVSEILGGWARVTRPRVALLHIVGERWAPRSHEMLDLLERSSFPYRFYGHDSDEGQRRGDRRGPRVLGPRRLRHRRRKFGGPGGRASGALRGQRHALGARRITDHVGLSGQADRAPTTSTCD